MRGRVVLLVLGLLLGATPADGVPRPADYIVFVEQGGEQREASRLLSMRPDGRDQRVLHRADVTGPAASPDGRIAFSAPSPDSLGRAQILVIDRRGGKPQRVTYSRGALYGPTWSPDGRQIAFLAYVHAERSTYHCELRVLDLARRAERTLLVMGTFTAVREAGVFVHVCGYSPSWSPDGREIALSFVPSASTPAGGAADPGILTLLRADGTSLRHVPGEPRGYAPRWSPDGRRLVFVAPLGARTSWAAQSVAVDGTARRVHTPPEHDVMGASYSPDGRHLVFASWQQDQAHLQIHKVPVQATGPITTLTSCSAHCHMPVWGRAAA